MQIIFELSRCLDCRHLYHYFIIPKDEARKMCSHPSLKIRKRIFKDSIPKWCPLKHGAQYNINF